MLAAERRDLLLARLEAEGKLVAKDLARALGVYEDSVRRDLRELDGGTTTLAVVRALPRTLHATVITHSPTIAAALVEHPAVEVFLLGGRLYKHSAVTCGVVAADAARAISADVFLLGVTGVHPIEGLTTGDAEG